MGPFSGDNWSHFLILIHTTADVLSISGLLTIAITFIVTWRSSHKDVKGAYILLIFISFIIATTLSRLVHIFAFYWLPKQIFIGIGVTTSVLAMATACYLPGMIYKLVKPPNKETIQQINRELEKLLAQETREKDNLGTTNTQLKIQIQLLQDLLYSSAWLSDNKKVITQLREVLSTIEKESTDGSRTS